MPRRTVFGWQPLADILKEPNVRELITSYCQELSPIRDVAPLDPDWDELLRRDREGKIAIWTAHVEETLAGFIMFYLTPHLFYKSTLMAMDGGHYLAPGFRGAGRLGYAMWRSAGVALEERGVKVIMAHDNAARPLLPFFLALGYEPRSTIFWKILGDEP